MDALKPDDPIQLSREWFINTLSQCLDQAVRDHGDPARIVAWDVRKRFDERLDTSIVAYIPVREGQ